MEEGGAEAEPVSFDPKLIEALLRKHWQADAAGQHATPRNLPTFIEAVDDLNLMSRSVERRTSSPPFPPTHPPAPPRPQVSSLRGSLPRKPYRR